MIVRDDVTELRRQRYLLLLFDLPNKTRSECAVYRRFKKHIKQDGYVQLQESIYLKILRNVISVPIEVSKIEALVPEKCDVKMIPLTYASMDKIMNISGSPWPFEEQGKEVLILSDDL